jgi:Holliday junction resolvase
MGKINSSKKGSKNERELAKAMEVWSGIPFARVPRSGGLRWQRTLDTTGDLIVASEEHIGKFPFSIETKFHESVDSWKLLRGQKSKLDLFWAQAKQDAKRGNKIPIVFFRFNGLPKQFWFIIISHGLFQQLRELIFNENGFYNFNDEFVIFPSDDLFESDYKQILDKVIWMRGQ